MGLSKYENVLISVILFMPSIYLWRRLYKNYFTLKKEAENQTLFYEKHNCVIMYSRSCIRGWPPETITINTGNLYRLLDPYLYFINTAKHTLNIAIMMIGIDELLDSIIKASKRNVKVRLIVNFLSVKNMSTKYNKLIKSGVKIAFYVDRTEMLNNIMHCKYMVKDYDCDKGFVCMGSMNFTGLSTILNNFEDIVFSSNIYVVKAFHKHFESSWDMIKKDNESVYDKSVLTNAGFLQ